mgnify:CR=1 FL=1
MFIATIFACALPSFTCYYLTGVTESKADCEIRAANITEAVTTRLANNNIKAVVWYICEEKEELI